jgi:hypothetical protein
MKPISLAAAFLAVLALAAPASAWGPYASRFICNEAVKFVWGTDAVAQCLPMTDNESIGQFCEAVYRVMGQGYEEKCMAAASSGAAFEPSLASYDVLKDADNHFDYGRCPIKELTARAWVCGDSGDRPARRMFEEWMGEAEKAPDLCSRIFYFCVAGSYYADSESSLHQVRHVSNDCVKNVEDSVDRSMMVGTLDWSASQICVFNNQVRGLGGMTLKERMGESSPTVARIIANLTEAGQGIRDLQYSPRKGVVVLANRMDEAAARELIGFLGEAGVKSIAANASAFETLKYNPRIIILGGQNSPEGSGAEAASVLSPEDEENLLAQGKAFMFVRDGPWASGQKVVVLAGNEAADTSRVAAESRQRVLEEVKQ